MAKKIEITIAQAQNYNRMIAALKTIKFFQSPERLKRYSEKDFGLGYEEALEMAYENMQGVATKGLKRVSPIKIETP